MNTRLQEPVLVVGAGPVGLTAAINLTLRDYPVRIVEARSGPSTYSKAIGINARTLELLEPAGVTERLLDAGLNSANHLSKPRPGALHGRFFQG